MVLNDVHTQKSIPILVKYTYIKAFCNMWGGIQKNKGATLVLYVIEIHFLTLFYNDKEGQSQLLRFVDEFDRVSVALSFDTFTKGSRL